MDWGLIVGIVGAIISIVGIFVGIFSVTKKNSQNISPKTKYGSIDMSRSNYTIEKNIHSSKDPNCKK